eukprot:894024-Prorocentrum_minimum.AAC.1
MTTKREASVYTQRENQRGGGRGRPKGAGAERGDQAERGARKTGARVREGQGQTEPLRGPRQQ